MTGMTEQMWLMAGAAAVLAALIGFLLGRSSGGSKQRVAELEAEVSRQNEEISSYKRDVENHFDKTATLVASMAGSYKNLFEHLSSGYEDLSGGSARQLFRDRVVGLLVGGAAGTVAAETTSADKVSAALIAAGAAPLDRSSTGEGQAAEEEQSPAPTEAAADEAAATTAEAAPQSSEGQAKPADKASGEGEKAGGGEQKAPKQDNAEKV